MCSQELRFTDANGNINFTHPTEIRAYNTDGTYLLLNSAGLGYYGNNNLIRSAIGADGQVAAESITAGTLTAVKIQSGVIRGSLITNDGNGMNVYIGTSSPASDYIAPDYGGYAMYVDSSNYVSMVSSGQIAVVNKNSWNSRTTIRPGSIYTQDIYADNMYIQSGGSNHSVLTTADCDTNAWLYNKVRSWVADYITVNGKQHTIWKG